LGLKNQNATKNSVSLKLGKMPGLAIICRRLFPSVSCSATYTFAIVFTGLVVGNQISSSKWIGVL